MALEQLLFVWSTRRVSNWLWAFQRALKLDRLVSISTMSILRQMIPAWDVVVMTIHGSVQRSFPSSFSSSICIHQNRVMNVDMCSWMHSDKIGQDQTQKNDSGPKPIFRSVRFLCIVIIRGVESSGSGSRCSPPANVQKLSCVWFP